MAGAYIPMPPTRLPKDDSLLERAQRWLWETFGEPVTDAVTGMFDPFRNLGAQTAIPAPPQPTATGPSFGSTTRNSGPPQPYVLDKDRATYAQRQPLPTQYTYLPGVRSDGLNPFNPYGPRAYGPLPGDPSQDVQPTSTSPIPPARSAPGASNSGGAGGYGIPAGVDPGWYRQFVAEHDGATPEQVYRSDGPDALRHADFDRQWGDQFYRTYGRRPSVYDWKASYYQRQAGFYGDR